MRLAMAMLLLISMAFAQFEEFELTMGECKQLCCADYDGSWDWDLQDCTFRHGGDELGYYECNNECMESGGKELSGYGRGNLCSASAILFGLVGVVLRR